MKRMATPTSRSCGIGSWGGRRPSLGGYVTGTRATDGATPAGGVHVDYPQLPVSTSVASLALGDGLAVWISSRSAVCAVSAATGSAVHVCPPVVNFVHHS